jgi:hypothetical protein
MNEVAVDIEEGGAVRLLIDQVVVPDLVVEGFSGSWLRSTKFGKDCVSVLQAPASHPSDASSRAKNRAGRRAWSSIAAKAIVECALSPLATLHERAGLIRPGDMRAI